MGVCFITISILLSAGSFVSVPSTDKLIIIENNDLLFGRVINLKEVINTLRKQVMEDAKWAMEQQPVTVTAQSSPRSSGDKHDFFSEGDYWWPDPRSVDSPYVQKDGMTNPDNFTAHRHAMIRLSRIIGALASAYKINHDEKFVKQALLHCAAWFVK